MSVYKALAEGCPNMGMWVQPAKFLAQGDMTLAYRKPASERHRLLFAKLHKDLFSPEHGKPTHSSWSCAWDIARLLNAEHLVMKQIPCVVMCPQIVD